MKISSLDWEPGLFTQSANCKFVKIIIIPFVRLKAKIDFKNTLYFICY
jgi:hypothetical protein